MLRLGTLYPRYELESNNNLSDLDLYDKARRAERPNYEVIPQPLKADDIITTGKALPTD